MFRVENADFIADKLAAELLPNQEYREVAKNAEEAVDRRMSGRQHGRPDRVRRRLAAAERTERRLVRLRAPTTATA